MKIRDYVELIVLQELGIEAAEAAGECVVKMIGNICDATGICADCVLDFDNDTAVSEGGV